MNRILENTLATLHRLWKVLSFKQWLNNYNNKIGDNSGLIFLRTTTGMLSGPVVFLRLRLGMFCDFQGCNKVQLKLCSVRRGKLGRCWSLSSNVRGKDKGNEFRLIRRE